jgi:hypothetical protein
VTPIQTGDVLTRLGSGARVVVIAQTQGMVRVRYVDSPLWGRQATYHAAELGDFFTRASYPPDRRAS